MAGNSVDYIIKLVADDSELKKKLSSGDLLNKSEMGKVKKLLTSIMDSANRDAKSLGRSLQDGLNVDTTQLEKTLKFISGIFGELEKTGNPIKDWAKTGKGVYQSFDNMQTSIATLAQNVGTLQTGLNNLNTSFETFKNSYQSFHPTQFANMAKDVEKAVSATAKLTATNLFGDNDKSLEKLEKLKKALSTLKPKNYKLEIDDSNLETEFKKTAKKLNDLWDKEAATGKSAPVKEAQLYARMKAIEERQIARGGKSFIYGEFTRQSKESYDATLKDWETQITETATRVKKQIAKLEEEVNGTLNKGLAKTISDQLSTINLQLSLSDSDKQKFESQIDAYIAELNENKKFQAVKVDLNVNEPNKDTQRGRPKTKKQDVIDSAKNSITKELEEANNALKLKQDELAELEAKRGEHPNNTRLAGKINRVTSQLATLEKSITRYKFLMNSLEGSEGADIAENWNRLESSRAAINAEQEKLLSQTKVWRQQMNNELRLQFAWDTYDTESAYAELVGGMQKVANKYLIPVTPDVDYFASYLETALEGKEIKVKATTDGPLQVNGGVSVGNVGLSKIVGKQEFKTVPASTPVSTPVQKEDIPAAKSEYVFTSQVGSVVDKIASDASSIVSFAKSQIEASKNLWAEYLTMLKEAGYDQNDKKGISDYIESVVSGKLTVSNDVLHGLTPKAYTDKLKRLQKETSEENSFFISAAHKISELGDVVQQNSGDEQLVENATREMKEILINSVVESFKNYFTQFDVQFDKNSKNIRKYTKIRDKALQAYNSDESQKARATAIGVKQNEIDGLMSNPVLQKYADIRKQINILKVKTDESSQAELAVLQEQERNTLPAIRQEYEKLVKLKQELAALYQADPKNKNLIEANDAQKKIDEATRRNQNLVRRREAYKTINVPMTDEEVDGVTKQGLKSLLSSGNKNDIFNFIIDTMLSKADISQRMGPGVKAPTNAEDFRYFSGSSQRLATQTVELVQTALGLAQKTSAELDRQVRSQKVLADIQKTTAKHRALKDLRDSSFLASEQSDMFKSVRTQFTDDWSAIEGKDVSSRSSRDQRYLNFKDSLGAYEKASLEFREVWTSFDQETRQNIAAATDRTQVFNQRILDSYNTLNDSEKKEINKALKITKKNSLSDILSQSDHAGLVDIYKKISGVQSAPNTAIQTLLATIRDRGRYDNVVSAQEAFENSLKGVKGDATHRREDSIPQELSSQLSNYVFRVKLVDDNGNTKLVGYNADPKHNKALGKITKGGHIPYDENLLPMTNRANNFLSSILNRDDIEIEFFAGPNTRNILSSVDASLGRGGSADYVVPAPQATVEREGHQFAQNTSSARQLIERAKQTTDLAQADLLSAERQLELAQSKVESGSRILDELNAERKRILGDSTPEEIKARVNAEYEASKAVEEQTKKTPIDSGHTQDVKISNEAVAKINAEREKAEENLRNAQKILSTPLDTSLWTTVNNLPDSVKQYAEINKEIDELSRKVPQTQEETEQIRNRLQTLKEQKATSYRAIEDWVKQVEVDTENQRRITEDKLKANAPKLAKQYQNTLVDLATQAESLDQQLQQNPDDVNIQNQLKNVISTIKQVFGRYQNLLSKYGIVTKGFLGNEAFSKASLARHAYGYNDIESRSTFKNLPKEFETRDTLLREDSEIGRKLMTATEEEKKALEARRAVINELIRKADEAILKWVAQQEGKVNSGLLKGLTNSPKLKNLEKILSYDFGDTQAQTTYDEAKAKTAEALERRRGVISSLSQLQAKEEDAQKIVVPELDKNKELMQLAQRRLEIEREIKTVQDEGAKRALETELAQNKARSIELGAVTKRAAVDPNAVKEAYYKIIDEATLDIGASENKIKELTSQLQTQKTSLKVLSKEVDSSGDMNKRQKSVINAAFNRAVEQFATTDPNEYETIRKKVEAENPRPYITSDREEEEYQRSLNGKIREVIREVIRSRIDEKQVIDNAKATQQGAIRETEALIASEQAYKEEMQSKIRQAMQEGGITQEMLDERRGLTQAIRSETQATQQSAQATQEQETEIRTHTSSSGEDRYYTNYDGGQVGGIYNIDTSGLATEETLRNIWNLLGGDVISVVPSDNKAVSSGLHRNDNTDYQKAIEIIRQAIGSSKAKSEKGQAKVYAEKVHSSQDVIAAAEFLKANKSLLSGKDVALWNKLIQFKDSYYKVNKPVQAPTVDDDDSLDPNLLAKIQEMQNSTLDRMNTIANRLNELEKIDTPDAQSEKIELQKEFDELQPIVTQMSNTLAQLDSLSESEVKEDTAAKQENASATKADTEALRAHEAALEQQVDDISVKPDQDKGQTTSQGGIIGIMRSELAQESTLQKVLASLGEIAKKNAMAGAGKANSAQDLLEQFRRMLESDAWEGRERVAYVDLTTGSMSNSITGDNKAISAERLSILRAAYKDVMDLDAQVHTHANEEDSYFSPDDLKQFASDFTDGVTKQILLSKNNMTVLDMAGVQDVNGLLDALAKTEHNFEALATTAEKFGARYVNRAFSDLTPQGLVKMLGIKGIESKYTETETRESARKGVLAEEAKEAADMLQESTGRAIKKTVERVGLELETLTEKTDAKGNKIWTSQINNKFGKAMKATNKDIEAQKLDDQFGVGTKAATALNEYREQYQKLTTLVDQFNSSTSATEKTGLQKQINDLLPVFNKAEKELIDLIARKEQFLRNGESLGILNQDSIGKGSLEDIATKQFFGDGLVAGQNIATAGTQATKNGRQLLVDILDHGTISRYGIEVDEVTGQVRKLAIAEGDLANAFQNVNRAMKFNETVQASVAIGDDESQIQQFLKTASSPIWDTYKTSLLEMQNYTANLWNTMKEGGSVSQQELDYLMALSERVITLGKNIQKTSIDFKSFWDQNPQNVFSIDKIAYDPDNKDEKVREELEKRAKMYASASNSEYAFSSFDNDTLQFTMTDAEGQIRKVTYEWNELYNQIAITSDKSTSALDPMVAKINKYDEALQQAVKDGYLMEGDSNFDAFYKATDGIKFLVGGIEQGYETFDTAKEKLYELRQEALRYGEAAKKTIAKNKKLYTGTNEMNSVNRQRDKIIGSLGAEDFEESDVALVNKYKDAYRNLNNTYKKFAEERTLYDTQNQETLRQQAVGVQNLGRKLASSITQADKLKQLVEQTGTYTDIRGEHDLGGMKESLTEQEIRNLEETMRNYVQNTLQQADIENVKFNNTTKQLTYTLRTGKHVISDMVVQYNDATNALYAYNKQERESLTGFPALMKGFKSKIRSILQYTASITSIYRIWGTIKRGVQYIREIDSALTELKKVTDETEKSYDKFLQTAAKTADKVGSTIKEVVSSTADWARLNI